VQLDNVSATTVVTRENKSIALVTMQARGGSGLVDASLQKLCFEVFVA